MHTGDDIGGINTNFLEVNDELPNSANNRGEGIGDADNNVEALLLENRDYIY